MEIQTNGFRKGWTRMTERNALPYLTCVNLLLRPTAIYCFLAVLPSACLSQTATIDDAWLSYQQDCNGDGCQAGTLAGDFARLNWNPDVVNCNGTLTVYEVVYSKPCASSSWTALYTNAPHTIIGCRSSDSQALDVQMASGCACYDYKIEIYR